MTKSSAPDPSLDATQRADVVAKEILKRQFDTLLANLDGVRANQDPEFLHDLRVATRRTRSALTQIKGVFPGDLVEIYKSRFAWLQQVTNPLRDLDVHLLHFEGYEQSLPASLRPALEPLRDYLLTLQEGEHGRLLAALDSDEFVHLVQDWLAFLDAPVPEVSGTANGLRPVKELADERIWRLVRRVRREGRALRADSPPEDLHELRKSCKKLRYLMEFFRTIYPDHDIRRLIDLLKTLLDHLGGFQDLVVQVGHLSELAQRMRDEGRAETATLLAMGALIGHLLERQQALRDGFAAVFADAFDKERRALCRELFASGR
ncbi:metal-chelation protein CHAD [Thiocystis minor]|uniref:CHAD domain-containing protein n=1 Tax=Thiocystis minor TaxID=61597 RepID=UPI00191282E6|nr:CHAD domain-containing protein [Thiocystis minor]MBK5964802.1 metal-chelation protein CHAD [Thiocystis minor]